MSSEHEGWWVLEPPLKPQNSAVLASRADLYGSETTTVTKHILQQQLSACLEHVMHGEDAAERQMKVSLGAEYATVKLFGIGTRLVL